MYNNILPVEKMNILICDDEEKYAEELKYHIEKYMAERYAENVHIDCYTDPAKAMGEKVYDLVFLDIQMNDTDGITLAKALKKRNNKVIIFFVTAYNGYQDEAMDLRAFRFFEKPFDPKRLYTGLDKAMEYLDETYLDIYLYKEQAQKKVLIDNIVYIESGNRKTTLYTLNGKYETRESIEHWYNLLPHTFFYKVHKSFLVNLHYVETYKYTELFLNDGTRIPVSPRKQASFHKYWNMYLSRR